LDVQKAEHIECVRLFNPNYDTGTTIIRRDSPSEGLYYALVLFVCEHLQVATMNKYFFQLCAPTFFDYVLPELS